MVTAGEALTAVTPGGAVVGIARYIRLQQSSTAEVAVAVADHWCGRGIATLLLAQIAARARAAGIDCLTALCLASNTAVLGPLSRLGPMTTTRRKRRSSRYGSTCCRAAEGTQQSQRDDSARAPGYGAQRAARVSLRTAGAERDLRG